jgi:hypothetical protein
VQHQFFVPVIATFGQIQFWTYKENLPIEADDTAIITTGIPISSRMPRHEGSLRMRASISQECRNVSDSRTIIERVSDYAIVVQAVVKGQQAYNDHSSHILFEGQ